MLHTIPLEEPFQQAQLLLGTESCLPSPSIHPSIGPDILQKCTKPFLYSIRYYYIFASLFCIFFISFLLCSALLLLLLLRYIRRRSHKLSTHKKGYQHVASTFFICFFFLLFKNSRELREVEVEITWNKILKKKLNISNTNNDARSIFSSSKIDAKVVPINGNHGRE